MKSNLAEDQTPETDNVEDIRDPAAYRLAGAAFDLIEKHKTPPVPTAYSLWYAYASNTPEAVTKEVDAILETSGKIGREQIDDIYDAHLSRSKFEDVGERVSKAIEDSLSDVSGLISKTNSETEVFQQQLDGVGAKISQRPKRRDVIALFEQLMSTNAQMSDMAASLSEELQKSQEQVRQLNEEFQVIKKQSRTDALTDVANRRAFNERLSYIYANAQDTGEPFTLALLDLDKFKQINDLFGHPMGDEVLSHMARLMVKNIEDRDFVARIGGDEFAIIFPGQSVETAYTSMVAIKHQLENLKISEQLSRDSEHSVTFSCGMSEFKKSRTIEEIVDAADRELLNAKRVSRNHISIDRRRD